jgi:uncharacterized protein
MEVNNQINYVEFRTHDLEKIKAFYTAAFGWEFTDYGPTYTAFSESGIAGGFEYSDQPIVNGALVILYHQDLEKIKERVIKSGGSIVLDIFSFPGGRRFHFMDPTGNELAIWAED